MKTGAGTGAFFVGGKVILQGATPKHPMLLGSGVGFGKVLAGKPGTAEGTPRKTATLPATRARPEPERAPRRPAASTTAAGDPLDPVARQAAQMAPPLGPTTEAATADVPAARARTSLEELLPALVRRVAWSGDGRKGTVRLELGAGGMAGAEVVVESDEGRVRVQLKAPAGVDGEAWRRRVEGRLTARGLQVEGVVAE